jgi:hypothetical protein
MPKNMVMSFLREIVRICLHLWKGWFFLLPLALLVTHIALIQFFDFNIKATTNLYGLVAQIVGVVLILSSLQSDMLLFKGKSFIKMFVEYLKQFKTKPKKTNHIISAGHIPSATVFGNFKVINAPTTLEDRIKLVEDSIEQLQKDIDERIVGTNIKIQQKTKALNSRISSVRKEINQLSLNVNHFAIGNWKWQVFGGLLIAYSAGCSYYINGI